MNLQLTTDTKSEFSNKNVENFLVYQTTINKKCPKFSPLSLFHTSYRLTPHSPHCVKSEIVYVRG